MPQYLATFKVRATGDRGRVTVTSANAIEAIDEMVKAAKVENSVALEEYAVMELIPETNQYIMRAERYPNSKVVELKSPTKAKKPKLEEEIYHTYKEVVDS